MLYRIPERDDLAGDFARAEAHARQQMHQAAALAGHNARCAKPDFARQWWQAAKAYHRTLRDQGWTHRA